jgi:hypothetical protein
LFDDIVVAGTLVKGNYLNLLSFFSTGCETMGREVERTLYSEREIAAFIRKLDICLAPGTVTESYYRKPLTRANLVVFAGAYPVSDYSQLTLDAALRFVYPAFNPKVSFNIALHYSHTDNFTYETVYAGFTFKEKATHEIFSLPFTIQYNFTSGFLQPYIYAGFSAAYLHETPASQFPNQHLGAAIIFGGGIEAYITHGLIIKADWRYELLSQYPAIGLAYKF